MPSILEQLAAQLQAPDVPRELPAVRQSPPAKIRSTPPRIDAAAVELRPGLWRLRRLPAFPAAVERLPWGEMGVPRYVHFLDHWYLPAGGGWDLVDYTTPVPHWHFAELRRDGDPDGPASCPACCFECGRRLFYRTEAGLEFCALCRPLKTGERIRGVFAEHHANGEPEEEPPNLQNVEFFLRAGFGTWDYPG